MPNYIVEAYAVNGPGVVDAASQRGRQAAALEDGIRHLRATFIPGDETVLHLFEASTAETLQRALQLASLRHERVVEAIEASGSAQVAK